MIIRPENGNDVQAIFDLTKAAFAPMGFSDGTEPGIIDALRADGDLLLSLVGVDDDIIAHVAFSPMALDCAGRWAGLGPISVAPGRQKQGIGTLLVREGLAQLKHLGFDGCVLIGNPKVYGPMGFVSGGLSYRDLPKEIVQWHAFGAAKPSGEITFAAALEIT
jgi:putative acetyltransferase